MPLESNVDLKAKAPAVEEAMGKLPKPAEHSLVLLTKSQRGLLVKAKTGQTITSDMAKLLAEEDLA